MLLNVPVEVNKDETGEVTCHICNALRPAFCFTLGANGRVVTAGLCHSCEESLCRSTARGWISDVGGERRSGGGSDG